MKKTKELIFIKEKKTEKSKMYIYFIKFNESLPVSDIKSRLKEIIDEILISGKMIEIIFKIEKENKRKKVSELIFNYLQELKKEYTTEEQKRIDKNLLVYVLVGNRNGS